MSLTASREKLRIMASMADSGSVQRLSAVRVLPGGELVAVEDKRRITASQSFRREASALHPEIGKSQRLLRDFDDLWHFDCLRPRQHECNRLSALAEQRVVTGRETTLRSVAGDTMHNCRKKRWWQPQ